MHGNVMEWCNDGYELYPTNSLTTNPQGLTRAAEGVIRGGHWGADADARRSVNRERFAPGFASDVVGGRWV